MDLPPDGLEAFFPFPEDGTIALEFGLDIGGSPLGILECLRVLARIRDCRAYVIAAASFGRWLEDEASLSGAASETARDLRRALEGRSRARAIHELGQLAQALGLFNPLTENHPRGLEFDFVGAFLQNPTIFRFIARGTTYSLVLAVSILGLVQARKQWGADACLKQAEGIAKVQFEMLQSLARMEGKWTPQHAASHNATLVAVEIASRACGSSLDGIDVRIRVPPGIEYEIRLGPPRPPTPPAPGPSPKGG